MSRKPIALTCGEPAGIGPDLVVMLAQNPAANRQIVVLGSPDVLQARAKQLHLPLRIRAYSPENPTEPDQSEVIVRAISVDQPVTAGVLNRQNAKHVLSVLDVAIEGCINGDFAGMVTAPLHKGVINDANIAFTGHTEYLAEKTNAWPVMMLATDSMRVALATTHMPLSAVASALTRERLLRVLKVLNNDLQLRFGLQKPKILVCGLNPHAGEGGHLGREEIEVITPVVDELRQTGMHLSDPLPADTLFTPRHLNEADAVLAMYHDQGLPVLKYAGFGEAVNITLGLPILRTSVDHGTALDLAGSGNIESGSLLSAIQMAKSMAYH